MSVSIIAGSRRRSADSTPGQNDAFRGGHCAVLAKPEAEAFHVEEPAKKQSSKSPKVARGLQFQGKVSTASHTNLRRDDARASCRAHYADAHEHNGLTMRSGRTAGTGVEVAVARNWVEAVLNQICGAALADAEERKVRDA